jgi:hypothetical protein
VDVANRRSPLKKIIIQLHIKPDWDRIIGNLNSLNDFKNLIHLKMNISFIVDFHELREGPAIYDLDRGCITMMQFRFFLIHG